VARSGPRTPDLGDRRRRVTWAGRSRRPSAGDAGDRAAGGHRRVTRAIGASPSCRRATTTKVPTARPTPLVKAFPAIRAGTGTYVGCERLSRVANEAVAVRDPPDRARPRTSPVTVSPGSPGGAAFRGPHRTYVSLPTQSAGKSPRRSAREEGPGETSVRFHGRRGLQGRGAAFVSGPGERRTQQPRGRDARAGVEELPVYPPGRRWRATNAAACVRRCRFSLARMLLT